MDIKLAKHIDDVRKSNKGAEIIIIMHAFNWINSFKCYSSFNDADIYPRVDVDLKEITILPKDFYFTSRVKVWKP